MCKHLNPAVLVALFLGISGLDVKAQSIAKYGGPGPLPLAKLCMPVSYRQGPSAVPIRTKITMLGDRYHEVLEALAGWNKSGVPLVGQSAGQWEPVPCGDDTGLFYLVPLIARETGWSADRSLEWFLLGLILASAIVGQAGLWLDAPGTCQRLFSTVPILASAFLAYKMGDVYVVQASLVLVLLPWLIYGLRPRLKPKRRLLIVLLAGVFLGFGQWMRTQSGSALIAFFAVLLFATSLRRSMKLLVGLTLLIGMCFPLLYAQLAIHKRDAFLGLHKSNYHPPLNSHLLWHTAYLGLAYLTNPYVSEWRDAVAVDYVESIDPNVIYGSEDYETLLRLRVLSIAQHDFRFIFYTFAAKVGVLACILLLCTNIGFAAAIACPKPLQIEVAFWLAMAIGGTPGIIAVPVPQYVLGMIALAFFYWYYSIFFYIENDRAGWWRYTRRRWAFGGNPSSNLTGTCSNKL